MLSEDGLTMKAELIKIQNVLKISKNISAMSFRGHCIKLLIVPRKTFKQNILEAYFVKIMEPCLNSHSLEMVLHRHRIPNVLQIITFMTYILSLYFDEDFSNLDSFKIAKRTEMLKEQKCFVNYSKMVIYLI